MDQETMVSEQTESGKRLIEALGAAGFEVRAAFWAKPTEEGKWYLYLVSPFVDDKGPAAAYRFVNGVLRKASDIWIDPFDVKVVGLNDSLAEAVLEVTKPNVPESPFGARNAATVSGDDPVRWNFDWRGEHRRSLHLPAVAAWRLGVGGPSRHSSAVRADAFSSSAPTRYSLPLKMLSVFRS